MSQYYFNPGVLNNEDINRIRSDRYRISDSVDFSELKSKIINPKDNIQTNQPVLPKGDSTLFDFSVIDDIHSVLIDIRTILQSTYESGSNENVRQLEFIKSMTDTVQQASKTLDQSGRAIGSHLNTITTLSREGIHEQITTRKFLSIMSLQQATRFYDRVLGKFAFAFNHLAEKQYKKLTKLSDDINISVAAIRSFTTTSNRLLSKYGAASPEVMQIVLLGGIYDVMRLYAMESIAIGRRTSANELFEKINKTFQFGFFEVLGQQIKRMVFTIISPVAILVQTVTELAMAIGKSVKWVYDVIGSVTNWINRDSFIFLRDLIQGKKGKEEITRKLTVTKPPEIITAEAVSQIPDLLERQRVLLSLILETNQNSFRALQELSGINYSQTQNISERVYVRELGEFLDANEYADYQTKLRDRIESEVKSRFRFRSLISQDFRETAINEIQSNVNHNNRFISTQNELTNLINNRAPENLTDVNSLGVGGGFNDNLKNVLIGIARHLKEIKKILKRFSFKYTEELSNTSKLILDEAELSVLFLDDINNKSTKLLTLLDDQLTDINNSLLNPIPMTVPITASIDLDPVVFGIDRVVDSVSSGFNKLSSAVSQIIFGGDVTINVLSITQGLQTLQDETVPRLDEINSSIKSLILHPSSGCCDNTEDCDCTRDIFKNVPINLADPTIDNAEIVFASAIASTPITLPDNIVETYRKLDTFLTDQLHIDTSERLADINARRREADITTIDRPIINRPTPPSPAPIAEESSSWMSLIGDWLKNTKLGQFLFSGTLFLLLKDKIISGVTYVNTKFIELMQRGFGFIKDEFTKAIDFIKTKIQSIAPIVSDYFRRYISDPFVRGMTELRTFIGRMVAPFRGALSSMFGRFSYVFDFIKTGLGSIGSRLRAMFPGLFTRLESLFSSSYLRVLGQTLLTRFSGILSLFTDSIRLNVSASLPQLLNKIPIVSPIINFITGAFSEGMKGGKSFTDVLVAGLKNMVVSGSVFENAIKFGIYGIPFGGVVGFLGGMAVGAIVQIVADMFKSKESTGDYNVIGILGKALKSLTVSDSIMGNAFKYGMYGMIFGIPGFLTGALIGAIVQISYNFFKDFSADGIWKWIKKSAGDIGKYLGDKFIEIINKIYENVAKSISGIADRVIFETQHAMSYLQADELLNFDLNAGRYDLAIGRAEYKKATNVEINDDGETIVEIGGSNYRIIDDAKSKVIPVDPEEFKELVKDLKIAESKRVGKHIIITVNGQQFSIEQGEYETIRSKLGKQFSVIEPPPSAPYIPGPDVPSISTTPNKPESTITATSPVVVEPSAPLPSPAITNAPIDHSDPKFAAPPVFVNPDELMRRLDEITAPLRSIDSEKSDQIKNLINEQTLTQSDVPFDFDLADQDLKKHLFASTVGDPNVMSDVPLLADPSMMIRGFSDIDSQPNSFSLAQNRINSQLMNRALSAIDTSIHGTNDTGRETGKVSESISTIPSISELSENISTSMLDLQKGLMSGYSNLVEYYSTNPQIKSIIGQLDEQFLDTQEQLKSLQVEYAKRQAALIETYNTDPRLIQLREQLNAGYELTTEEITKIQKEISTRHAELLDELNQNPEFIKIKADIREKYSQSIIELTELQNDINRRVSTEIRGVSDAIQWQGLDISPLQINGDYTLDSISGEVKPNSQSFYFTNPIEINPQTMSYKSNEVVQSPSVLHPIISKTISAANQIIGGSNSDIPQSSLLPATPYGFSPIESASLYKPDALDMVVGADDKITNPPFSPVDPNSYIPKASQLLAKYRDADPAFLNALMLGHIYDLQRHQTSVLKEQIDANSEMSQEEKDDRTILNSVFGGLTNAIDLISSISIDDFVKAMADSSSTDLLQSLSKVGDEDTRRYLEEHGLLRSGETGGSISGFSGINSLFMDSGFNVDSNIGGASISGRGGAGSGGSYGPSPSTIPSSLPTPVNPVDAKSKRAQNAIDAGKYLINAANETGVDLDLLSNFTNLESGYRSTAAAPRSMSSAYGYGQFVDGTWVEQVKRHGKKYGVIGTGKNGAITDADAMRLRNDKRMQALMTAEYAKQGIALAAKYNLPDKEANVYAHHNLGPGGAKKLFEALTKNPNARIETILSPKEIANNPSLYKPGMTVSQAYSNLGAKVREGQGYTNLIKESYGLTEPKAGSPAAGTEGSAAAMQANASVTGTGATGLAGTGAAPVVVPESANSNEAIVGSKLYGSIKDELISRGYSEEQASEVAKFGVSQSAIETGWFKHHSGEGQNYFGIKADKSWTGNVVHKGTWEVVSGNVQTEKAKFRAYASPEDSARDWVKFLHDNPRYNKFIESIKNGQTDPKLLAGYLKEAGYASDPDYVRKVGGTANGPTMAGLLPTITQAAVDKSAISEPKSETGVQFNSGINLGNSTLATVDPSVNSLSSAPSSPLIDPSVNLNLPNNTNTAATPSSLPIIDPSVNLNMPSNINNTPVVVPSINTTQPTIVNDPVIDVAKLDAEFKNNAMASTIGIGGPNVMSDVPVISDPNLMVNGYDTVEKPSGLPEEVLNMRVKTSNGSVKTVRELGINSYEELQQKGGQAFKGGYNDPATTYATALIQKHLGDNFGRVTAQNDAYHQKHAKSSGHTKGTKTDFTLQGISYREGHRRISTMLAEQYGLREGTDFKIISTKHGTGDHIDFKLNESGRTKMTEVMTKAGVGVGSSSIAGVSEELPVVATEKPATGDSSSTGASINTSLTSPSEIAGVTTAVPGTDSIVAGSGAPDESGAMLSMLGFSEAMPQFMQEVSALMTGSVSAPQSNFSVTMNPSTIIPKPPQNQFENVSDIIDSANEWIRSKANGFMNNEVAIDTASSLMTAPTSINPVDRNGSANETLADTALATPIDPNSTSDATTGLSTIDPFGDRIINNLFNLLPDTLYRTLKDQAVGAKEVNYFENMT